MILGKPWLHQHNPQIDWRARRITFHDAYCSNGCLCTWADVYTKENGQPDRTPPPAIYDEQIGEEEENPPLAIMATSISARIASEHVEGEKPLEDMVPEELHN